ncbi:MAG: histidinol-phosphatase HisJ family protein [Clostridia bacterium]|nr:histidinol-phosphatase HisJ family protein [Clostridia bacterium]
MNLLCDMHVHSRSSHDSEAIVCEIAQACIEKGISAFAITDHCDIQYFDPCIVDSSFKEVEAVKREYGDRIKVLAGIEIGEAIWNMPTATEILKRYDFDVIVGSVHAVRYKDYTDPYSTIDFSKMSQAELDGYLSKYFEELLEMVSYVDCDIMAHLTCPLRYICGKYNIKIDMLKYQEQIDKILDLIIEKSVAMEINTSGIGTVFDNFMPFAWIIERFKQKGGYLVTLGSDAHIPQNVGKGFELAIKLLKELGFDGYYYYEKRKSIFCKI